jgi:hypothetical protein
VQKSEKGRGQLVQKIVRKEGQRVEKSEEREGGQRVQKNEEGRGAATP